MAFKVIISDEAKLDLENSYLYYRENASKKVADNVIEDFRKSIKIISIGDITSKTIEEYGLKVYKQSETATIASMIDAISNDKFNLNTGVLTC